MRLGRLVACAGVVVVLAACGGQDVAVDRADLATTPTTATASTDAEVTTPSVPTTVPTEVTTSTAITEVVPDDSVTLPPLTLPPLTLPPLTAPPPPSTTEPSTTEPFEVPEGAIDLGYQVYIPLPEGYEQTSDDPVGMNDGTTHLTVQVVGREPGEDPLVVMQNYVDLFDDDFEAVSYSSSSAFDSADGAADIVQYSVYYDTFDAEDGIGISGGLHEFVRGDGLTLLYDIFAFDDDAEVQFPRDAFATLSESFRVAPLTEEPVPLTVREQFRVSSMHTVVQVDEATFLAFTAAPGFKVLHSGDGHGWVSNGIEDFEVVKFEGIADLDGAIAAAQEVIARANTDLDYVPGQRDPADEFGVERATLLWYGTYKDGEPVAGEFDVLYDLQTHNAVAIMRNWYTNGDDANEPFDAECRQFMFLSFVSNLAGIP